MPNPKAEVLQPSSGNDNVPNPERIMQLAWGYAPPLVIEAAIQVGLFDELSNGPASVRELAARLGASERGLVAICNALAAFSLLEKSSDRYTLVPESAAFLASSSPHYRGEFFRHGVKQMLPRWMHLADAVRSGNPIYAVDQADTGSKFFSEFVEALYALNFPAAQALGRHLNVEKMPAPASVLDIGAGAGVWGFALAHQSKHMRVHAVDWPAVLEVTRRVASREGLEDRLTTSAGDLLEADFGAGHTVAVIGHILHSEGGNRSKRLLKKTFDALAPGGTIAIAEWIPNEDRTGPPPALLFAVNMLVHTKDGDTFTFGEISSWLRDVGFVNPRLLDAPAPSPLVLATKP